MSSSILQSITSNIQQRMQDVVQFQGMCCRKDPTEAERPSTIPCPSSPFRAQFASMFFICFICSATGLDFSEQVPVLNLERLPDAGGEVDGIANELSLLSEL
jgi:hypothetical protein